MPASPVASCILLNAQVVLPFAGTSLTVTGGSFELPLSDLDLALQPMDSGGRPVRCTHPGAKGQGTIR